MEVREAPGYGQVMALEATPMRVVRTSKSGRKVWAIEAIRWDEGVLPVERALVYRRHRNGEYILVGDIASMPHHRLIAIVPTEEPTPAPVETDDTYPFIGVAEPVSTDEVAQIVDRIRGRHRAEVSS